MAAGVGISGPILLRDVGWVCLGMGTHPTHPLTWDFRGEGVGAHTLRTWDTMGYVRQAGGTHPTTMLSFHLCFLFLSVQW